MTNQSESSIFKKQNIYTTLMYSFKKNFLILQPVGGLGLLDRCSSSDMQSANRISAAIFLAYKTKIRYWT